MAKEFEEFVQSRRVAIGKLSIDSLMDEVELIDNMALNGWELTAVVERNFESYITYYFRANRNSGWDDES